MSNPIWTVTYQDNHPIQVSAETEDEARSIAENYRTLVLDAPGGRYDILTIQPYAPVEDTVSA